MCLMVVKKKEQSFDPEYIESIYNKGNRDGFGLAYVEGERKDGKLVRPGRIKTVKSMDGVDELKEIYRKHMDANLILHLRNATLGEKNLENCHPYTILSIDEGHKIDLVMMHNGTIRNVQIDKAMSDSWNFSTQILKDVLAERPSMLFEPKFRYMLCALLDTNKLIFMDNRERILVINSDLGSYHDPTGVWMSSRDDLKIWPKTPINRQFGANSGNQPSKLGRVRWPLHNGGEWVMEADSKSHFVTSEFKKDSKQQQKTSNKVAQQLIPATEEEVIKAINEAKVDSKDIEEFEENLRDLPQQKVYEFVREFPVEAAYTLHKIAKDAKIFEEITSKPVKAAVQDAFDSPWETTFAIVSCYRVKDKVIEVK